MTKPVLSAPPPTHTVALLIIMVAVFTRLFPSTESLDQVATVDIFTHRLLRANIKNPEPLLSLFQLAIIRFVLAVIILGTSLQTSCLSDGWTQSTPYTPRSKLIMTPIRMKGWKTILPFTSLSWNLLGLYFTTAGWIAYQQSQNKTCPVWLLRSALILWEIAAPLSFLVAAVVRYAIWPAVLKTPGGDTTNLKSWRNVLMHNMNVVFALTESGLLSGVPVVWNHFALAPLIGCAYIVMSWNLTRYWTTKEYGAQFIYFFFDTTVPGWTPSIALLALLLVLMVFYALFVLSNSFVQSLHEFGWIAHVVYVVSISSLVVRFRD